MEVEADAFTTTVLETVTLTFAVFVHPLNVVPVTVYEIELFGVLRTLEELVALR